MERGVKLVGKQSVRRGTIFRECKNDCDKKKIEGKIQYFEKEQYRLKLILEIIIDSLFPGKYIFGKSTFHFKNSVFYRPRRIDVAIIVDFSLHFYKRTVAKGERAIINGICHDSINDLGRLEFVYKGKGWRKIGGYLITGRYLAQNVGN